jgi:ATP-dependent DNA ligase
MEARSTDAIPSGPGWQYEPKWDGFRCLAFRNGDEVLLQSKSTQPLGRYFPELLEALREMPARRLVLDGEIVVPVDGHLDFDALLQRIHPADSRIRMLAKETPATLLAFDLLVDDKGADLTSLPLSERRQRLERFFSELPDDGTIRLSPASTDRADAERWMEELAAGGLDGVIAKRRDAAYVPDDRSAMRKIKKIRTADCVVGGFRYTQASRDIGSLLLGLYDDEGLLHHVGFSSSFRADERKALKQIVEPLIEPPGFTGNAPGGPSRWATERTTEWHPLRPTLVGEFQYDHFSGHRFRHGTKLLRWRPDKAPKSCTFAQLQAPADDENPAANQVPAARPAPRRSRER